MEITFDKIPTTPEEFVSLRDKIATTPEGGAAVFAIAMIVYGQNKKTGLECLTIAVDKSRLMAGDTYKGFSLNMSDKSLFTTQVDKQPYLGNSYVVNTKHEEGYTLPPAPFDIEVITSPSSGDSTTGKYKVFIKSTGADSARPVTVAVNDKGLWKAYEWSSLLVGVRASTKLASDDL